VTVTEKQTGNIQVGAGYSQAQGVVLSGGISQANIFGTGNFVQFDLNTSKLTRVAALSFTNPYATPDGVSRGYDIYERHYDQTSSVAVGSYQNNTAGAGLRSAIPISEYDSVNVGLNMEVAKLSVFVNSPQQYIDFVNKYGDKNLTILGSTGWARDTRDSSLFPTRGNLTRLTGEMALPGGDVEYFKLTAQEQWFYPLSKRFTFLANVKGGYAHGYNDHDLPFYANFFAGGVDSVRGYESSSLGPQGINGAGATGGNKSIVMNLEVLMPVPGIGSDKSTRISAFVDGGNVWGPTQNFGGAICQCKPPVQAGGLRYSTGLAFSWLAPVGPMKFSLAEPLNAKSTDHQERFQFSLGRLF
jgi:outer membrane protein insertion porin family